MNRLILTLSFVLIFFFIVSLQITVEAKVPFASCVDKKGVISLPSYLGPEWAHLGTWVVTSQAPRPGAAAEMTTPSAGIHNVYTQTSAMKEFKRTGRFPDGAVLVLEVRSLEWDDLPTGHVIRGGEAVEWFVMVKDQKQRFEGNPNWGDGWGWALFKSGDPGKNISVSYKSDCLDCHRVADETDLVFTNGLSALR